MNFAGHFARLQIYHEERLASLDLARIFALLLDAGENRP